jgi:hypothetical protein
MVERSEVAPQEAVDVEHGVEIELARQLDDWGYRGPLPGIDEAKPSLARDELVRAV